MSTGAVHSWDIATAVDGPGTRFVVFTAGCPLRCQYCQNPETWHERDGQRTTVDELMAEVVKYRRFIEVAGGGVTVSGGEPLLQHEFVGEFLHRCKEVGLHTALDTSGFLGHHASDALLADTDLVLLDIKSWDPSTYRRVTGEEIAPTLAFARRLSDLGKPMWIRFVLVPGLTDDPDNVEGIAEFVATLDSVERVDVLPFHQMGKFKWEKLGMEYQMRDAQTPSRETMEKIIARFSSAGLKAV